MDGDALAMWKSSASPSLRAARTSTMSGKGKRRRPAPSATPWDGAGDGELSPAERIVRDCHRDIYGYRHAGAGLVGEAAFFNGYDRDACPRCGSPRIQGNGRDANGVRRWRCLSCGRAFNPATGTVFDGRKLPVADWTEFLLEVFSYGSLAGSARSGPQVGHHAAVLARQAARGAGGGAGGRRPGRPGGDRRDDVPAAAGGPAEDARRLQGPGRLLQGEALHRHRLRRERGGGVRRRGARQDQRRAHPRRLRGPCGARLDAGPRHGERPQPPGPRAGPAQRAAQRQAPSGRAGLGEPARRRQPAVLPAAPVPRLPHGVRPRHARRLPGPFLGDDEPSPRQDGDGGVRSGSGNAQPENAPLQGLLREEAQFRR